MLGELRKLIAARPFLPFTIYTAGGAVLSVPTADHIAVAPAGARVVVFDDDGTANLASALLIDRIVTGSGSAESVVA